MPKGKGKKPQTPEMAIGRVAHTEPREMSSLPSEGPVRLIENDTGCRFLVHVTDKGVKHDLLYEGDQPWFTQKQMANMFGVDLRTVSDHITNFVGAGELGDSVIRKFRITAADGKSYEVKHYALDVAFYVGYRVNSDAGMLFRKWATAVLIQFATKGFVIDKPALKGKPDRLAELREIIREIRSDEANVYAELRRICSMCADYDPSSQQAHYFYGRMQAKLYWATVSHTGAELLRDRVDGNAENCGLQTWDGDHVLQGDVTNAKNTLADRELKELNRVTDILLSVFEDQLDVGRLATMADADRLLDEQLAQLGRAVLQHGGSISSDAAKTHAKAQYKIFAERRSAVEKARRDAEIDELKKFGSRRKSKP